MKDERLKNIRLIATDMDGTLTTGSKFTSTMLESLEALAKAEIFVLIVTGRSAGWVEAIANYLPLVGAIAENGGIYYHNQSQTSEILTAIPNLILHRQQLGETFQFLKSKFNHIQESADNQFRLTDWTFDVAGLTSAELEQIGKLCEEKGWSFTYSNVQCHIKPLQQDKATSLLKVLSKYFPQLAIEQIITVGDSPNDESLFDRAKFPLSIGVANVVHYLEKLKYQPTYVTDNPEGKGFCELVEFLI